MASNMKMCASDGDFDSELTAAGSKLVVVDFFATWCGPCRVIAPKFAEFANKYPNVVFLKVDVDQCREVAMRESITAMPTFNLYKAKVKVDSVRGANETALEAKIKEHMTSDSESSGVSQTSLVKGHIELNSMINKAESECLNEADDHPWAHCLTPAGGYLESDCDEQLLLHLTFNQPIKLHSLQVQAPVAKNAASCPKTIKIFSNLPHAPDFDKAEGMDAVQTLELTNEDMAEGAIIPLKFVKFQNVGCVTLFFKDNQGGADTTQIDYLSLIGSPLSATNMSEFKRVAGKKGESH